jgi:nicotinate phosphoribosyltransferase
MEAEGKAIQAKNTTDFSPLEGVDSLLTDMYQVSMAYAYWRNGQAEHDSVFDLFFRKAPFKGEYTIFAGLSDCLRFINNFHFDDAQIAALKILMPHCEEGYWTYLKQLDCSGVKVYALNEGQLCFPRVPMLRIEGPLGICQLLETTLLVLVNFASLITTNAARHRVAAGPNRMLVEFGLRRAQGVNGGMTASKYAYVGGFDGTSNIRAGVKFGMPVKGTHAHSFVTAYRGLEDLKENTLQAKSTEEGVEGKVVNFVEMVLAHRARLGKTETNIGELTAFISYAQSYPDGFLALVDTYDVLRSGVWNYVAVSLALTELGYTTRGIRLDSGDLAYLSKECRKIFKSIAASENIPAFAKVTIVASNDLSEMVLYALERQVHEIDCFGIGTHLVTCKAQPALGCVYKLVEINSHPRIKISQDVVKITIPGRKTAYRLYDKQDVALVDLMQSASEDPPVEGKSVLCKAIFNEVKRVRVTPSRVEPLLNLVFAEGKILKPFDTLDVTKARVARQVENLRQDHRRVMNPTPYKVSVTTKLHKFAHDLLLKEMTVPELS